MVYLYIVHVNNSACFYLESSQCVDLPLAGKLNSDILKKVEGNFTEKSIMPFYVGRFKSCLNDRTFKSGESFWIDYIKEPTRN